MLKGTVLFYIQKNDERLNTIVMCLQRLLCLGGRQMRNCAAVKSLVHESGLTEVVSWKELDRVQNSLSSVQNEVPL